MPTTLLCTTSGIGLGIMARSLAEHVPEITKIIGVRRAPGEVADLRFPDVPTEIFDREIDPSAIARLNNDKYIYIEQSYGMSAHIPASKRVFVPMWEQEATAREVAYQPRTIAVTHRTESALRDMGARNVTYLPWPVEVPPAWRCVERVRTVLHNAGSLGGNLRKGTLAAIRIFQRSGLAKRGVRLVIHSWKSPTPELAEALAEAPEGIQWTGRFVANIDEIYEGADLLLMPSKIEGHALCALEAMARGIPVLATDYAPINEYATDSGQLLHVASWERSPLRGDYAIVDIDAAAQVLTRAYYNSMVNWSEQARMTVEKGYSWTALRDKWREVCA